jgi:hypothetical protein
MDKVIKAEIAKELANECYKNSSCFDEKGKQVDCLKDCAYVKNLSSSLTSLIIKWLESKKVKVKIVKPYGIKCMVVDKDRDSRNQLITELVEEMK